MKSPSAILIVDSNIILSALFGTSTRPVLLQVQVTRSLRTTARAIAEISGVLSSPALAVRARRDLSDIMHAIDISAAEEYANVVPRAEYILRGANADKKGSATDAHILACAWVYHSDIWSHDRDFAGSGWPSWSTANVRFAINED